MVREKQNFFVWYYGQGVHELLEIWKNFLLFFWKFFSIWELTVTLLSPWRKDVTIRNWRGFHPQKSLQLLVENVFSRLIGMVVRTVVIVSGIFFFLLAAFVGLVAVFLWMGFPVIVIFLLVKTFSMAISPFVSGGIFLAWLAIVSFAYFLDRASFLFTLGLDGFYGHVVSRRMSARFGISGNKFPPGIIENSQTMQVFLKEQNIKLDEFQRMMQWEFDNEEKAVNRKKFWRWENLKKIQPIGSQWHYGYTVNLDRYATDLSVGDYSEYRSADLVGRNEELEVLKLVLQRPDQNCALIVGNAGIGKKTLLHHLARKIRHNNVEGNFLNLRILLLDLGRAISDAINRGKDVENTVRALFHEAAYAGNVILAIEHLENYLGKEGNVFHPDISAVISEYLSFPAFQIIGTSTPKEYHHMIERQGEIVKYFEVIEIREPSDEQTINILLTQLSKYEKRRVIFTYEALRVIVKDSNKYNWEFPMPERALDLAMAVLSYWEKNGQEEFITEKTVSDFITLKTGIPQGEISADEGKKLLNLEKSLHRHVIGQEEAVKQVAEALRRARSGIANSQKPIGSFLFLGPTGVGKTETAKALARAYFGDENKMIRLDMSEFQSPGSLDRLIGSSQLNQQGRLITQIKDNPYSLLLLDEIEKAYPEILDIFLQILDEGFVTDAFGEKVNFRNCIIIATSNVGAPLIKNMVAENKGAEEIKQAVIDYAVQNGIYRLEFLNRFSGVVFFRPLNQKELRSVVQLLLGKFSRRLAKEKNMEIEFGPDTVDKLIEKGYNPMFGARSLDRYIESTVEDLVATKIIAGEVKKGEKINISL